MNIELQNISKSFLVDGLTTSIFTNINLNLRSQYTYVITGDSGIGKTTLMHIIGGLELPTQGIIKIKEGDVEIKVKERNIFGFVFQDHNLIYELNVEENLLLPLIIQNMKLIEAKQKIITLLSEMNLLKLIKMNVSNLSGGEKQRVAILRAILSGAKFILADEPSASLDKNNAKLVLDLLLKVHKEQNVGLILTSHEPDVFNHLDFKIELKNESANIIKT